MTDYKALYEQEKEAREAAEARAAQKRALSFKVSEKGALSVYGLHSRFPVTLYVEQWERLIAVLPTLQVFMRANEGVLSRKPKK